jgi:hypothetical protein
MRVVSMPERPRPAAAVESPSPVRLRSGDSRKLYVPDDTGYSRKHERTSTSSDVPYTPTPPSSPESSVLIIGNHVQLPRIFMRNHSDGVRFESPDDAGATCLYRQGPVSLILHACRLV